ncbi:uncharacterized protein [Hyperolius riggenbachi]|uniref:uncharacterized protein isoform X3 n=1 Tax=Hyperolius riggenbachi TaxID=752182 RepID=UPI0035A2F1DE
MSDSQGSSQGTSQVSSQGSSLEMDCSEPYSDDTQPQSQSNTVDMRSAASSLETNMDMSDYTGDGNDNEDSKDDNNNKDTSESSDVTVNVIQSNETISVCVSLSESITDKQPKKRKSDTEESEAKKVKKTRES